jgi:hypothetical protein
LNSQEGVKAVVLSGLRATVIMEDGAELSEEKVKSSLEKESMGFESMESVEMPRPKSAYLVNVSGAT